MHASVFETGNAAAFGRTAVDDDARRLVPGSDEASGLLYLDQVAGLAGVQRQAQGFLFVAEDWVDLDRLGRDDQTVGRVQSQPQPGGRAPQNGSHVLARLAVVVLCAKPRIAA